MVIEPDVPASKAYDQGLAQLAAGAPQEAAKKFTDLGEKFPDSDWARKGLLMTTYAQFQGGDYDSAEIVGRALRQALSQVARSGLCALSRGERLLQPDPRHFPRPGARRQGARRLPAGGEGISELRIRRGREIQDPGDDGSARRQRDVDRPLLSQPAQLHRRDQPLPQRADLVSRPPATPRRRSIASRKPISASASPTRRRPPPRCSATTSPTASGIRTPTTC